MSDRKYKLNELLDNLENITKEMDVPVYRRRSVSWLHKNLSVKNKLHPLFYKAMTIINELLENGVAHG